MRTCILIITLAVTIGSLPAIAPLTVTGPFVAVAAAQMTADQMKSDLVGQTMGGREKCWKFQNRDQIRDLEIKDERTEGDRRVYSIVLKLSDARVDGAYRAEATVWYARTDGTWRIEHVGLRALVKLE